MIFSELYSAYYNTVAAIISGILDGEHSEKELQNIVADRAFGESVLTIMPSLKIGKFHAKQFDTRIKRNRLQPLLLKRGQRHCWLVLK